MAAARLDGFWERGLKPWDIAAGIVLVREVHSLLPGADPVDGDLAVGNKALAGQMNGRLQKCRK